MHAFVQRLPCGVHVFFRAGPLAKQHGDDWTHGCLGEVEGFTWVERFLVSALQWLLTRRRGRSVTLMGYDDKAMPPLVPGVLKAMTRAAIADGFESLELERRGHHPHTLRLQPTGDGKGITMKSFPQDHLKKSHKAKYTYDAAQVSADLRAMADAVDSGDIVLITRRVSQPVNEASDGSGAKASYAFLEWKHK